MQPESQPAQYGPRNTRPVKVPNVYKRFVYCKRHLDFRNRTHPVGVEIGRVGDTNAPNVEPIFSAFTPRL